MSSIRSDDETDQDNNRIVPNDDDDRDPCYWCNVCDLDLQSHASLELHRQGRKHWKRLQRQVTSDNSTSHKRPMYSSSFPQIYDENEIFEGLATKQFRHVVVLTGAGVSTAAGIPDFRTPGSGWLAQLQERFGRMDQPPEILLSRAFCDGSPNVWRREILEPLQRQVLDNVNVRPTTTHKFCAWLEQEGLLRRVYTQNVDGLHSHASLLQRVPTLRDKIVECHGSLERGDLVLYGDSLPQSFEDACDQDFGTGTDDPVDLVMVFGTSLQVAPFCAVPNLAPKGCVRVLVNRNIGVCLTNAFSREGSSEGVKSWTQIGSRKAVSLRSMWTGREGRKRWRQHLNEGDCDAFCERFLASPASRERGCSFEQFCDIV